MLQSRISQVEDDENDMDLTQKLIGRTSIIEEEAFEEDDHTCNSKYSPRITNLPPSETKMQLTQPLSKKPCLIRYVVQNFILSYKLTLNYTYVTTRF